MSGSLNLSFETLYTFLLLIARVSSAFVFVQIPGFRAGGEAAKVVVSAFISFALLPSAPQVTVAEPSLALLTRWVACEAALGITVGLVVGFLSETFAVAAQAIALQAGYSYASTIDPSNETDAGVLPVLIQIISGLLFLSLGLDRYIIQAFARSLDVFPPGTYAVTMPIADAVQRMGAAMFSTAFRLALPIIGLLALLDTTLALLSRINAQLQLLTLAFPLKMLGALSALTLIAGVFPAVFERTARQSLSLLDALIR